MHAMRYYGYLQRVADDDEEGVAVGRHGHPPPVVVERDLQAGRAVGAQHGHQLRVRVLAEAGDAARVRQALQQRARRVVVDPEHLIARRVRHHAAQRVPRRHAEPLRHRLEHRRRHAPHGGDVLVYRVPACTRATTHST